jgi:hypothetical protein
MIVTVAGEAVPNSSARNNPSRMYATLGHLGSGVPACPLREFRPVFVTSGAHNPTNTIMAVALRNMRRLAGSS